MPNLLNMLVGDTHAIQALNSSGTLCDWSDLGHPAIQQSSASRPMTRRFSRRSPLVTLRLLLATPPPMLRCHLDLGLMEFLAGLLICTLFVNQKQRGYTRFFALSLIAIGATRLALYPLAIHVTEPEWMRLDRRMAIIGFACEIAPGNETPIKTLSNSRVP